MIWAIFQRGPGGWRYIKAEPPCRKGELRMSFRWVSVTVGWGKEQKA